MNRLQVAQYVQDWVTANWDSKKTDYDNTENLLGMLNDRERRTRGKRDMEEATLLNALYEQVQTMREIALGKE